MIYGQWYDMTVVTGLNINRCIKSKRDKRPHGLRQQNYAEKHTSIRITHIIKVAEIRSTSAFSDTNARPYMYSYLHTWNTNILPFVWANTQTFVGISYTYRRNYVWMCKTVVATSCPSSCIFHFVRLAMHVSRYALREFTFMCN